MELALIPVAAILLLLSGVSAPAHAQTQQLSAVALMRSLLRASHEAPSRLIGDIDVCSRPFNHFQAPVPPNLLTPGAQPPRSPQKALRHVAHTGDRKLYRTRFGFAQGVYLAIGPPSVGLLADLG